MASCPSDDSSSRLAVEIGKYRCVYTYVLSTFEPVMEEEKIVADARSGDSVLVILALSLSLSVLFSHAS